APSHKRLGNRRIALLDILRRCPVDAGKMQYGVHSSQCLAQCNRVIKRATVKRDEIERAGRIAKAGSAVRGMKARGGMPAQQSPRTRNDDTLHAYSTLEPSSA